MSLSTWKSIIAPAALVALVGGATWYVLAPLPVPSMEIARPAVDDALAGVLERRSQEIAAEGDLPFGEDGVINILTLGIDSRKEGAEKHCDAIHLVTLNTNDWTVLLTSVPRGTYSPLPPGRSYLETDYYLANACAFGGLDYGITQIERVLGVKADYVATVGFSQALGIFRALDMPTTETLQWLRHRQSYQIGDPQRSQNQATFMKDVALRLLEDEGISTPMLYLLYSLVDTDLDFAAAKALYKGYLAAGTTAEDITFAMKPYYKTEELHFDPTNADEQIEGLLSRIRGRVSKLDLSERPLEDIQRDLVGYLEEGLENDEAVRHVVTEQVWRQVENDSLRESFHYRYLAAYVRMLLPDSRETAEQLVTDYILEMQFFDRKEWVLQGRALLEEVVAP